MAWAFGWEHKGPKWVFSNFKRVNMAEKGVWPGKIFSPDPNNIKKLKSEFLGSYLKKKFKLLKFVRGGKKAFPPPYIFLNPL